MSILCLKMSGWSWWPNGMILIIYVFNIICFWSLKTCERVVIFCLLAGFFFLSKLHHQFEILSSHPPDTSTVQSINCGRQCTKSRLSPKNVFARGKEWVKFERSFVGQTNRNNETIDLVGLRLEWTVWWKWQYSAACTNRKITISRFHVDSRLSSVKLFVLLN